MIVRRTTSLHVAAAAKVSQATVSRAFAGGKVSAKVRERIFEVARELNYQPNAVARSLTMGRSRQIGLIVSDQTSLIYPELVYELTEHLAVLHYRVMLFTTNDNRSTETVLAEMRSHRVDGVISLAPLTPSQCRELERAEMSVVLYNQVAGPNISSIYCDHSEAGRRVAEALVCGNYARIGVLAGPEESFVSGQFVTALKQRLADGAVAIKVVNAPYRYDCGQSGAATLTCHADWQPDCIICVNDTVAAGCIDFLRFVAARAVPEDIAIFALNGRGPSLWAAYAITALRQPTDRMAEAAVQAVLGRIDEPQRPAEHRVFFADYLPGKTGDLVL